MMARWSWLLIAACCASSANSQTQAPAAAASALPAANVASAAGAPAPSAGNTPLDRYVAAEDSTFSWMLTERRDAEDATVLVIEMTSQTWRKTPDVDRPLWQHWLTITVPNGATSDIAMLLIGGGRNGNPAPKEPSKRARAVAMATKTIVAELGQVPNQPLIFENDGRGRSEDDLVARSMIAALKSADPTWLAQLPMTKSAVRAMDVVQAAAKQYGFPEIRRFVVAGGSKRGWTTWLTAAVDSRVAAIAPIVIDVLNVQKSMQNHHAAYGFWAESLNDYTQQGLTTFVNSPFATLLFGQVDPYAYRDRLTMPKCIINATGDQFFTPDSSKLYYDDLPGEKMLCYVPNADHSLEGTDAVDTLIAFHASIVNGLRRPHVTWESRGGGAWSVAADMPAKKALLWHAVDPKARDFRVKTIGKSFVSEDLIADADGRYQTPLPGVTEGWTAYFVQLEFDIGAPTPLRATSPVWIAPDVLPYADGSSAQRAPSAAGE